MPDMPFSSAGHPARERGAPRSWAKNVSVYDPPPLSQGSQYRRSALGKRRVSNVYEYLKIVPYFCRKEPGAGPAFLGARRHRRPRGRGRSETPPGSRSYEHRSGLGAPLAERPSSQGPGDARRRHEARGRCPAQHSSASQGTSGGIG